MITKIQLEKLKPAPMQGVVRRKVRRGFNGKPVTDILGNLVYDEIPVMVYDPATKKKVQKMERGSYSASEIHKAFPNKLRGWSPFTREYK